MADEPLLQAFWSDVEVASPTGPAAWPSVRDVQQQHPDQLIRYLKLHGVKKLGETRIPATDLWSLFGRDELLTRGSQSCVLDWEDDWCIHPLPEQPPGQTAGGTAGTVPRVARSLSGSRSSRAGWASRQPAWLSTRSASITHSSSLRRQGSDPWVSSSSLFPPAPPLPLPAEEAAAPRQGSPPPPPQPAAPPASSEPPPAPTVVVESYLIAVRDAAAPGEAGLLRPLLRRWHLGTCTEAAFGLPAVQAVVSYKWSRFARRLLLQQLGAYGLWLGSFTAFMLLFNSSDADITDTQLLTTWKGRGAVASEALALVGMLPFAAGEVCVVAAYGLAGWLSAWNLLDCATYGMQLAITVLHLGAFRNGPYWLMLAVAVQAILLVVRLTFFSRVFKSTAFDFVGSLQTVVSEVGWYVAVLLLLMWGFACAFFTIFREDEEAADSFQSLPLSLLTMLNYAVGGTSYYMRDLLASGQPAAALALCTVYQFLVSMLLMSLLTGVMTNALMKVGRCLAAVQTAKEEDLALVLNRAQVIDELETVLPLPVLRLLAPHGSGSGCRRRGSRDGGDGSAARGDGGGGGGADVWMPYIHVLRVNPASLERIDGEEKLWPSAAAAAATDDEDDCEGRGGGAARRIKSTGHVETTAGGGTESGSGDALDEQLTAVQRLETQVQLLEGQLADVRGVVRHMLDLRGDVRQLLALMGEAATQVQQAQQRKEAQQLEAPPPLPPQSLEGQQAQQPAL